MNKRKRVFITGESGHLGRLLYEELKANGYIICNDMIAADMKTHSKKDLPFVFKFDYPNEVDITDLYTVDKYMQELKPDIVLHTAAYVNTDKCDEDTHNAYYVNAQAVLYLSTAFMNYRPDGLFVNFSTTATMDPSKYDGDLDFITCSTPRKPQTWYGQTKLMGEMIAKKLNKRWINFLPVFLFGDYPYDTSSIWARAFVANLEDKLPYKVTLESHYFKQYEYASNIIPLIRRIIENPKSEMKDIIIAGPEKHQFGEHLIIAREMFHTIFGKALYIECQQGTDYLKNHLARYDQMLTLANQPKGEFLCKRLCFRQGIEKVLESIKINICK